MCEYCNHVDKKQLKKNAKAQAFFEHQKQMSQIAEDDKKWFAEWEERIVNSFDLPPAKNTEEYMSNSMRRVAEAGRRLLKKSNDNYAVAEIFKTILNQVNLAIRKGDDYYRKYFPHDTTGEIKEINFKSTYFCGTEREEFIPLYLTTSGTVVRGGLHSCSKVWTCPVCGAKISTRRNIEVKTIINKAHKMKKSVYMLTLTAPHYARDSILSLAERMKAALLDFQNSRTWRGIKREYKWFGSIRTMETTIGGKNGAHNHFHIILIFSTCITNTIAQKIKEKIFIAWENACRKNNLLLSNAVFTETMRQLEDFHKHGVDLKRDFDPEYIAKQSIEWQREMRVSATWGAAEELTLSHLKKKIDSEPKTDSDIGGLTPFGFAAKIGIRAALGGYSATEFAEDCETLIEYCCAVFGRKQVVFSRGLREWAKLDEGVDGQGKTDEQLCKEQTDFGIIIGGFDLKQHRFIRRRIAWTNVKTTLENWAKSKVHGDTLNERVAAALSLVSQWFERNGLRVAYSRKEAELYVKIRKGVSAGEEFDFDKLYELQEEYRKQNRESERDTEMYEDIREIAEREKIAEETKEAEFEQIPLDFDGINDVENGQERDGENTSPIIGDWRLKKRERQRDECAHLG